MTTTTLDPMYADFRYRTGDAMALLEAARIALTFYRRDMDDKAPSLGFTHRDYPYGTDVERAISLYLGEEPKS